MKIRKLVEDYKPDMYYLFKVNRTIPKSIEDLPEKIEWSSDESIVDLADKHIRNYYGAKFLDKIFIILHNNEMYVYAGWPKLFWKPESKLGVKVTEDMKGKYFSPEDQRALVNENTKNINDGTGKNFGYKNPDVDYIRDKYSLYLDKIVNK